MNYTENYRGIKVDVQSPNADLSESVQEEVRASIDKLSRFAGNINAFDAYFKVESQSGHAVNIVGVRLGIPGPDVFAEESGENWVPLLRSVIDKLIRQLKKK